MKIRIGLSILLTLIPLSPLYASPGGTNRREISVKLNNQGVIALNRGDCASAIQHLLAAVSIDSRYMTAKQNLGIAYSNLGLTFAKTGQQEKALNSFRTARFVDESNQQTLANLRKQCRKMGRDPDKFSDHLLLAKEATSKSDYVGEIVELRQALAIHEQKTVRGRLCKLEVTRNERLCPLSNVFDDLDRMIASLNRSQTNSLALEASQQTRLDKQELSLRTVYAIDADVKKAFTGSSSEWVRERVDGSFLQFSEIAGDYYRQHSELRFSSNSAHESGVHIK